MCVTVCVCVCRLTLRLILILPWLRWNGFGLSARSGLEEAWERVFRLAGWGDTDPLSDITGVSDMGTSMGLSLSTGGLLHRKDQTDQKTIATEECF